MEDQAKVEAKLAALQVETGQEWVATVNTTHEIDVVSRATDDLKVFICGATGEVREYPYEDYLI